MYRYIKASYDPSMPNWLKSKAGNDALNELKYRYAMSEAQFFDTPQENSIPIHLLDKVYQENKRWGETYKDPFGQYVYIPNLSNGYSMFLESGNGYRRLGTIAKSKLNDHIIDTVYMVAPLRSEIRETRDYVDPRYDRQGNYMGQYKREGRKYNRETGEWEHDPESDTWEMASVGWADAKRDKSGYAIPDPEELYRRLYARFPDRLKSRVNEAKDILDEYYDKVNDAKEKILSKYDIRKGRSPYLGYGDVYKSELYQLHQAIQYYGSMYKAFENCMTDDGSIDPQKLATYMKGDSYDGIPYCTKNIDSYLSKIH